MTNAAKQRAAVFVQIVDRADHAAYVATIGNRVVGFIHISMTEALEHEPRGEIRTLPVDENHRSTGIGERLLEKVDEWAKERHLLKIRVRCNVNRERARRFYERHGYEVVKSQHVFDKTLRSSLRAREWNVRGVTSSFSSRAARGAAFVSRERRDGGVRKMT